MKSPKSNIAWPQSDVEQAAAMWKEGMSGGEISKAMGGKYSRTAVIGKMNRIGLARAPVIVRPPVDRMKKWGRPIKEDYTADIIERHDRGQRPSEIANRVGMKTDEVIEILKANDIDAEENIHPPYQVHPMWSMPEDERRQAFYEKFSKGWAEVQERLRQ